MCLTGTCPRGGNTVAPCELSTSADCEAVLAAVEVLDVSTVEAELLASPVPGLVKVLLRMAVPDALDAPLLPPAVLACALPEACNWLDCGSLAAMYAAACATVRTMLGC